MEQETFKTTLLGGFDKEDVLEQVQRMRDEAAQERKRLSREVSESESQIHRLQEQIDRKDEELQNREEEIRKEYQKYIDKYESISKLVFEAQVRADEMIKQAGEECERMRQETQEEIQEMMEQSEREMSERLADGKKRYLAIQREINGIADLVSQVQRSFMASYKEIHNLVNAVPETMDDTDLEEETV